MRGNEMLATDVPVNPAYTKSLKPVVAVLGQHSRVATLGAHLPNGWTLRAARALDDIRPDEIVLLAGATERDVRAARSVLPRRVAVVALVDAHAPADVVAGVLTEGADVCVRGGTPAILAGHLVACRRRQLADRWSTLRNVVG
ncbi:hypothetical protein [Actinoplanes sp. NPDC049265]|uniref:hypothetical protein n=1 Tax=Actinoplanes sp. NPDC049265 TaxID=3363902 RepID=UPI0037218541